MTEPEIMRRLVAARHHHGLTQQDVADRLHVSRAAIGRFETINASHTLATILRYAWALGVDLHIEGGRVTVSEELLRIARYSRCHEDVTRKGESQPCDLPAVAIRLDTEDNSPYPVCSRHTRKPLVTLAELMFAVDGGIQ